MSITDELRSWAARRLAGWKMLREEHDELTAIADRIDAEHERKVGDWDYWESTHVELPKDADGVPWHRGDRVIDPKDPDGKVNTVWIAGDNTLITDDHLFIFSANELRHYHAPTVEDVLREFANEVYADADNEIRDRDFLCAKYAKRLTLAEGEDA